MKTRFLLLIASISLSVSGCKRDEVDPRDRYVGRFNIVGTTSSFQLGSSVNPSYSSASDVLIITKGTSDKDLVLSVSKNRLTATLSEDGFFVPPQAQEATATNGTKFYYNYDGSGTYDGTVIDATVTMNATVSGIKIREITVMKGSKQ